MAKGRRQGLEWSEAQGEESIHGRVGAGQKKKAVVRTAGAKTEKYRSVREPRGVGRGGRGNSFACIAAEGRENHKAKSAQMGRKKKKKKKQQGGRGASGGKKWGLGGGSTSQEGGKEKRDSF